MSSITSTLLGLASPWAYVAVGLLALLEASAFVGLVIPGELAMLLGGFIAHQGRASVWVMAVAGVAGAVAGDSIGYEVGRTVGPRLRRSRAGRWVGEERWGRADAYVKAKGGRAVFGGRFVGVLRAMVPTVAGVVGMPYRRFLLWNASERCCGRPPSSSPATWSAPPTCGWSGTWHAGPWPQRCCWLASSFWSPFGPGAADLPL